MKTGKSLVELAMELERQKGAKADYLLGTEAIDMSVNREGAVRLNLRADGQVAQSLAINEVAHGQLATALGIPSRYYDRMLGQEPDLLAINANTWLHSAENSTRMIRTLDGTARAYLSDKYRRIDNDQIAEAVLPMIAALPDARVESCEVTDRRLYLKVVNPRLQAEVSKGDVVQSGILISNSEVGLGSVSVLPLIYRLVCTNGMIANDAGMKRRHVGRINEAGEDFSIFRTETIVADERAFMLKLQDIVSSVVDQVRFDRVVSQMRIAKATPITARSIPALVELSTKPYGVLETERESVLDYLIRGGDLSLYGLANAVTRAAQDVESYDRSTDLEGIGFSVMTGFTPSQWENINERAVSVA